MCGIAGKIVFNEQIVDAALIRQMCDAIVHRGPDDDGVFTAAHIGLGQRRLSIIDVAHSGTAPLSNEDGTVWVVFNGEIYNYQELRNELIEKGHQFQTHTDTEVIVHAYEEMGTDCLGKFRGMFAFAIWDTIRKQLFAARDRLGKKPFCFARIAGGMVFGSEIKAITADPEISATPNMKAIHSYLTYGWVPSPMTAFEGIQKLRPGHYMICSANGTMELKRYWSPPPRCGKTGASKEEIKTELRRLVRESVKLRMRSDVPLGSFLSGGIDSTSITALMAMESRTPIKTFSIGFGEEKYNELPYAKYLAERYQTEHHEFIIKPDVADVLPLLVKHYNEPFADSSALPTYYVAKMTSQHVTVALSGDGGDESFAGYDTYRMLNRWERLDAIPAALRKMMMFGGCGILDRLPYNNRTAKISRGLQMLGQDLPHRYQLQLNLIKPQEKNRLYTRDFFNSQSDDMDLEMEHFPYYKGQNSIDWLMTHDQNFYLPEDLLVKTDIASMANSLEVRSPLLDHLVVEFAATIPTEYLTDVTSGKLLYKETFKDLLPEAILNKPKTGFGMPVGEWLRGDLLPLLKETLLGEKSLRRNMFQQQVLAQMIEEHVSRKREWSNRLWSLLFLEMWFQEFID